MLIEQIYFRSRRILKIGIKKFLHFLFIVINNMRLSREVFYWGFIIFLVLLSYVIPFIVGYYCRDSRYCTLIMFILGFGLLTINLLFGEDILKSICNKIYSEENR